MQKVLVTGVSGFLGGHIARRLLLEGHEVRGSVRDLARINGVKAMLAAAGADVSRLQFCHLDLNSPHGWDAAVEGCDCVMHVASPFVLDMPADARDLIQPAVEGTRHVIEAALRAHVSRLVLTSSLAAVDGGHPEHHAALTPDDWTRADAGVVNAYARSKTLAEQEAWRLVHADARSGMLAVVNPGTIVGPLLGDDPGTSGALILRMIGGKMPWVPDMFLSFVDVDDVAEAHVRAMQMADAGGARHIVANAPLSLWEVASILRERLPQEVLRLPRHRMPDWMTRIVALFDRSLHANRDYLGKRRTYDASSGMRLLGRELAGSAGSLERMARSLLERGFGPGHAQHVA